VSEGPTKAELEYETASGSLAKLSCMFNPAELSFTRTNSYEERGTGEGLDAPPKTFTGEQSGSFDVSLVFDTTDRGTSVAIETAKVVDLMNIYDFSGEERPPLVRLIWGTTMTSFWSVITETMVRYNYFGADGMPLRAEVNVEFEQAFGVGNEWAKQNPTSGTPDLHGRHRVQLGETLDRLAARYYGDATQWRAIADANAISDPLAIRPGRVLTIPNL